MIAAVVALHTTLFNRPGDFDINNYNFTNYHVRLFDVVTLNFLALAVPAFFLISLFLFGVRAEGNQSYFSNRIVRLVYMYSFWVIVWGLYFGGLQDLPRYVWHMDIRSAVEWIVTGNHSVHYFLFSLILLTCAFYVCRKLPTSALWLLLCGSLLIIVVVPVVVMNEPRLSILVANWSPMNFLPYVFIAALVSRKAGEEGWLSSFWFKIFIAVILVLTIVAAICEWLWLPSQNHWTYNVGCAIPSYTRLSVVGGTSAVFLLSFLVRRSSWRWVGFLADYSLGIYCLHWFVIRMYQEFFGTPLPFPQHLAEFAFVLTVTAIVAFLARRAFSQRLI
jgi:peptidoglycan/LPS O-acetylase OafA/YrhL